MKRERKYVIILLHLSFINSFLNAQGQVFTDINWPDVIFKGSHIQLNYSTFACFKSRVKEETGNYPVSTRASLGLVFGCKYQVNINNRHSLMVGPEAIFLGRNFYVDFNKNDFSPPLIRDYNIGSGNSYLTVLTLSLPVLFERRWFYKRDDYIFGNSGVRINFSTGADFDIFPIVLTDTNNRFVNVGGVDVYANNDAKPWLSFPISVGNSWLLKNNNLLQLAICANISFTKYVNGKYQVVIPGKPITTGNYSSTGSFIGLSLNYCFTNANYRIRKVIEKR